MSDSEPHPRVYFIANCMYRDHLAGGDIHFLHMAEAVIKAGFSLTFIGGHAVKNQVEARRIPAEMLLSDKQILPSFSADTLPGQMRLLFDYAGRFFRSLPLLRRIKAQDTVFAVTDYWFDAWPMILSKAEQKMAILGMDSPTLREIIFKSRPDVMGSRLASVYYWLSQSLSLRLLRCCPNKRLFYVHPAMRERLLAMGYRESELIYISNGIDVKQADAIPAQEKIYDAVWAGRVHAQKGISDLIDALEYLTRNVENFQALIIGRVQNELGPQIEARGISRHVTFSGFVSEEEKFRLLKSSRIFLMPSHYESWGIVIGEALACSLPVVAYQLPPYQQVFGTFIHAVPCFDAAAFQRDAASKIRQQRLGEKAFDARALETFKRENSWENAQARFIRALENLNAPAPN